MGFLRLIADEFPALKVVGVREGHDDADTNHRQTRACSSSTRTWSACTTSAAAPTAWARALKERRRDQGTVFVGHGLTPDTRALLIDGTHGRVITQHHRRP